MRRRTSRLSIALLATAALGGMACSGVQVRTGIEIDAPPEEVFAILSDLPAYPDWNPYHREVEGELEPGASLRVHIHRPDGHEITVPASVLRLEPNREITWGGGIKGIFWGEHVFLLSPLEDGRTLLRHDEDFSGFAVQFADLPPEVLTEGYRLMNEALKARVEQ